MKKKNNQQLEEENTLNQLCECSKINVYTQSDGMLQRKKKRKIFNEKKYQKEMKSLIQATPKRVPTIQVRRKLHLYLCAHERRRRRNIVANQTLF